VLAAGERDLERRAVDRVAAVVPPPFAAALRRADVAVIAEVKRRSPSKGDIAPGLSAAAQAARYAEGGAAALSILTEPDRFGGDVADLDAAAAAVAVPLLKKDFNIEPVQLLEAAAHGASAALLIARAVPPATLAALARDARALGLEPLVEIRDEAELEAALRAEAVVIGVNNRDLETLAIDPATGDRLVPRIPAGCVAVWESGVGGPPDVARAAAAGADAVLVGSSVSASDAIPSPRCARSRASRAAGRRVVAEWRVTTDERPWSDDAAWRAGAPARPAPPAVKFCGLTRPEDAAAGVALGASYLGVIFAGGPRLVTSSRAREVLSSAGTARRVGVFGAVSATDIAAVARDAELDVVQLHGDPDPAAVELLRRHWDGDVWAVVRCEGDRVPGWTAALFAAADAVVLDAKVPGQLGGTGVTVPWAALRAVLAPWRAGGAPLVLAGGLTPANVGAAVAALAPAVVDVSSGVEIAPGVKDHERMRAFQRAATGGAA
jgi:indole-3-glycerol phosphate synthase/phosphoribosylanthranilate isomerase